MLEKIKNRIQNIYGGFDADQIAEEFNISSVAARMYIEKLDPEYIHHEVHSSGIRYYWSGDLHNPLWYSVGGLRNRLRLSFLENGYQVTDFWQPASFPIYRMIVGSSRIPYFEVFVVGCKLNRGFRVDNLDSSNEKHGCQIDSMFEVVEIFDCISDLYNNSFLSHSSPVGFIALPDCEAWRRYSLLRRAFLNIPFVCFKWIDENGKITTESVDKELMMKQRERVIEHLQSHSGGLDDDQLALNLGFNFRQQANSICRDLAKEGLVKREKREGKILNFWIGDTTKIETANYSCDSEKEPWFWEGNIQSRIVEYLVLNEYTIRSVADTRSRQRGKDIEAVFDEQNAWVTVKGYPKGTVRTRLAPQARHWFKAAVYDMIRYRQENSRAVLFVALPDFPTYHRLKQEIQWFKIAANFSFLWVSEDGNVTQE
nr:hypothetical protein [Anaerolineae bacterium]